MHTLICVTSLGEYCEHFFSRFIVMDEERISPLHINETTIGPHNVMCAMYRVFNIKLFYNCSSNAE